MKKKKKVLLVLLFVVSGIFYYLIFGIENKEEKNNLFIEETISVKQVIDGDTLELNDSRKVRMLGVNTPEKGRVFSDVAISLTKNLENKTAKVLYKEKDKYGRILGYVLYENENFNKKLLEEGVAHLYYYEKDKFYEEMKKAENFAKEKEKGIWKKSKNFRCLELIELKYKEDGKRCSNKEMLVLKNNCNEIKVLIKDDSTKEFEEIIPKGVFTKNFSCVFNEDGDSLYVWDDDGILLFYRYP